MVSGQALAVWWISLPSSPAFGALFYVGLAISLSPIYPVTLACVTQVWPARVGGVPRRRRGHWPPRYHLYVAILRTNGWCSRRELLRSWPMQQPISASSL